MIQLNYRDSRPLYEQVKEGFRRLIVQGVLEQGEKLPSVRELATSLTINPNTIQRAYRELEQEGYLYTMPGRGSFVAGVPEHDSQRKQALWLQVEEGINELRFLRVTPEEIQKRVKEISEKEDKEND